MRGDQVSAVGSQRLGRKITCLLSLDLGVVVLDREWCFYIERGELPQSNFLQASPLRHARVFAMIRDRGSNIWLIPLMGHFSQWRGSLAIRGWPQDRRTSDGSGGLACQSIKA